MPEDFDLRFVDADEFVELEGWPRPVPQRCRVQSRRAALGRDVVVDVIPKPGGGITVVSLTVEGDEKLPVTGEALRSFRIAKLESALRIFLRLEPVKIWTTVTVLGAEDIARRDDVDPVFQSSPVLALLSPADPQRRDYLDDLKKAGPRTLAATETVRALAAYASANPGVGLHTLLRQVLDMPKATASRWIAAAAEAYPEIADRT